MSPSSNALNVGVVGAGIGGLAAALSLRNAGHKVTVFERYPSTPDGKLRSPIGNSMAFGANIARILDRWGIDLLNNGATIAEQERIFNAEGDTLKLMKHLEFDYLEKETGWPWYFASHASTHEGLVMAARQTPPDTIPITIHTGTSVAGVDCETGSIMLEDSKSDPELFDLVIAADGAYSKLIHHITDNTTPPMIPGRTAYRFKIPAASMLADPLVGPLYDNERAGVTVFLAPAVRVFLIVVEADDRQTFYGILMHPALEGRDGSEHRWDVAGSKQELNQLAQVFHPAMRRLCELAESPKLWTIQSRDPLKSCTQGKVVAIGDAVHPHLPHHGQGAASTVEDAASLGVFLNARASPIKVEQVPELLRQWEEFRLPRARTVQLMSISFPASIETLEDRIRNELGYHGPLPENLESHERPVQLWLFQYDVVEEAKKHLANLKAQR
jgi:salicylate hydroxylase